MSGERGQHVGSFPGVRRSLGGGFGRRLGVVAHVEDDPECGDQRPHVGACGGDERPIGAFGRVRLDDDSIDGGCAAQVGAERRFHGGRAGDPSEPMLVV